jgi:hypothetical protein
MFDFHQPKLAPVVRLVVWACLIAVVVILIFPGVSAAAEPSLEFNQSSYGLNDTVRVTLQNLGSVPSHQIIVSFSSDEENSTYITEEINNAGNTSYVTKNSVSKLIFSSNQTKISKTDIIYSNNGDSSGQIDSISTYSNGTARLNLINPSDGDDSITYRSEEYIILSSDLGNYSGNISLSSIDINGKLQISKPGKITASFVHPLTNQEYNNTVSVTNNRTKSEAVKLSPQNDSKSSENFNRNPSTASQPTPPADASRDTTGDSKPPVIGPAVGFYDQVTEHHGPALTVIAGVSEPIRGLGEAPPDAALAQLHVDGVPIDAEVLDDGSDGDRIRLRATDPPERSIELVIEGVIDRSGNRASPVRRPVRLAATVGSSSDESVSYIPGEPLAIVADGPKIRRVSVTTDTGWPLAERSISGPVVILQTVRWPDDVPVTLQIETADGRTRLQAVPVALAFSIQEAQVDAPGGPITALIEGPPTVRQLQVDVLDAAGWPLQQTKRWSSPSGRTPLSIPVGASDGPITLSVTDPTTDSPPGR